MINDQVSHLKFPGIVTDQKYRERMPLDQGLLKGTQSREWVVAKPPTGATPQWVYTGRDESGLGPIYVALASISVPPSRETMRALHAAYKGKSNIQLVVGAVLGNQMWIFGPDEKTEVTEPLALDQGCRQLQSALDEPDAIAAYTRLGQFRRSLDTTSLVGVTNSGLFASYHIRENVPKRQDWKESCEKSKPLLALRNEHLIKALGFKSEKTAGNALLLTTGTPQSRAVAILLDETEQFDATSARHTGISPVAFGLNVAARQGVSWLFVLRKDQIRIYPAKDGVGVGQKGQVETYLEIDLAAIDSERAGLLTLIFSANALEPNGTANDLLRGSQLFASQLGSRLRERIYDYVVPQLSKSVAEHLRDEGTQLDSAGLSLAYRLTLRILFRLLFQAYAEDRGLLPAGRNEGYDANSLKTIAKRIINTPAEEFGKSKTLWFDLVQVWDAIDEGNETWNVPAYNGGLFGTDPEIHPEGALIEKLGIHDEVLGPVLQHLLIDISEDNVPGPVDFRSLSVREFGTIYEGLLESSLSVASQDLTVDSKGVWIPAAQGNQPLVLSGEVYFHSLSGERKATGAYFTPSVIVEHLIEHSLDPALDAHLTRIKLSLDQGDEAGAARAFFDFKIADLAMGSGHFLVAAVDRIEAKMRAFLTDKDTLVPGVNAELSRLAHAAKNALGKDESAVGEIEPSALLRRQIARRCIYGLDVNPLAVELSRLALWIHTFVPGLPMSSLDHGLVCANSLTGIGTLNEARKEFSPSSDVILSEVGRGVAVTFFEDGFEKSLEHSKALLLEVANSDEASKAEVQKSTRAANEAKKEAEPALHIFNAAVAARIGLIEIPGLFEESHLINLAKDEKVRNSIENLQPAHMPFLFPEVFVRDNPGFDVVLGNPPWEELMLEEPKFWLRIQPGLYGLNPSDLKNRILQLRESNPDLVALFELESSQVAETRKVLLKGPYPDLGRGDIDLYQAFAWRIFQLTRRNGWIGIVVPRTMFNNSGSASWRQEVLVRGKSELSVIQNAGNWAFEGLDGRYSVAIFSHEKDQDSNGVIYLNGPFRSKQDFEDGRNLFGQIPYKNLERSSENSAVPLLNGSRDIEVFAKLTQANNFATSALTSNFRPVAELHATNDRQAFDSTGPDATIPVCSGSGFNIWTPSTGETYATANLVDITNFLQNKRIQQRRVSSSAFYQLNESIANDPQTLPFLHPRIAFRTITNSTNTRTVISALVPGKTLLTNNAPYLLNRSGTAKDEALILAILSSYTLDWFARKTVELSLNFHIFNNLPIPLLSNEKIVDKLITAGGRLAATDNRFEDWAAKVGVSVGSVKTDLEKNSLTAEIDACVAKLFGLNEADIRHIFSTFHVGWDFKPYLDQVLIHFREIEKLND